MLKFHAHSLAAFGATLVLAVATAIAAPAPALAATRKVTRVVPYGDLDLTRPDGVARLKRRISDAADRVCGPVPRPMSIAARQDYSTCRADALADAHAQLRRAEQAAHEARNLTTARN